MTDVMGIAKELADALAECAELKDVRKKEKAVQEDKAASILMDELKAKQMEYYNLQMEGKEPSPEMVEELNDMQGRIEGNLLIMDYLGAQERLGKMLQGINNLISQALSESSSCSGDCCSGCSGCN